MPTNDITIDELIKSKHIDEELEFLRVNIQLDELRLRNEYKISLQDEKTASDNIQKIYLKGMDTGLIAGNKYQEFLILTAYSYYSNLTDTFKELKINANGREAKYSIKSITNIELNYFMTKMGIDYKSSKTDTNNDTQKA